jgi:hypothetical protein
VSKSALVKIAAAVASAGVFAVLFMRSLEDTRTAAYTAERAHLQSWTLALDPAASANDPLLVLRPSSELAAGLFKQIFSRAMESLNSPSAPAIPLVLRGEFDRVVGDQMSQEAMLAAARTAGVGAAAPLPRCLVHRRISEPGGVRQVYLVLFDAPAIELFRRQIGLDPDALSPVMFVAGAGADFNRWLPLRLSADVDCLAPIEVGS